jgi:SAM-dependent methyltransferase
MAETVFGRLLRWANKPGAERSRALSEKLKRASTAPFRLGRANFFKVFLAHHPDAHNFSDAHPEFYELFRRFTSHNQPNNAGDITRLWSLILNLKHVIEGGIAGDFAELGVWRGNTASVLAYFAARNGRRVVLFDTFEGFDRSDLNGIDADKSLYLQDTSVDLVKEVLGEESSVCEFVKGRFPASLLPCHDSRKYAAISLDCDLYEPMKAGLSFFYRRMPKGGILFLHDYSSLRWDGARKAIDEFCRETGEYPVLLPDKSGTAVVRKSYPS